jgi:hypothetical protein
LGFALVFIEVQLHSRVVVSRFRERLEAAKAGTGWRWLTSVGLRKCQKEFHRKLGLAE